MQRNRRVAPGLKSTTRDHNAEFQGCQGNRPNSSTAFCRTTNSTTSAAFDGRTAQPHSTTILNKKTHINKITTIKTKALLISTYQYLIFTVQSRGIANQSRTKNVTYCQGTALNTNAYFYSRVIFTPASILKSVRNGVDVGMKSGWRQAASVNG